MTDAVLKDYRSAPIDERLRATLAFIETMTLMPDALSAADADRARAAGADDEMLLDAAHVCALFNIIVRIADTLEFEVPSPAAFRKQGKVLLSRGYR